MPGHDICAGRVECPFLRTTLLKLAGIPRNARKARGYSPCALWATAITGCSSADKDLFPGEYGFASACARLVLRWGNRAGTIASRASGEGAEVSWYGADWTNPSSPNTGRRSPKPWRPTGKEYVNIEFSNADHGFFCDERPSYQARAVEQAWALLLEFFCSE